MNTWQYVTTGTRFLGTATCCLSMLQGFTCRRGLRTCDYLDASVVCLT